MDWIPLLLTVASVHFAVLISPGPDFFLVTQVAAQYSRRAGMMTVLGITIGVAIWVAVVLLGLHLLVERFSWIQRLLYIAGGGYLSYLGGVLIYSAIKIFIEKRGAPQEANDYPIAYSSYERGDGYYLSRGLLTNLANPKALIYFGSVFLLFIGDGVSSSMQIAILLLVVGETFLWFTLVALLFSLPKLKAAYQRAGRYLDGGVGLLFLGFGVTLLYQALI